MTNAAESLRTAARQLAAVCADAQKHGGGEASIIRASARLNVALDDWCRAEGIEYELIAKAESAIYTEREEKT